VSALIAELREVEITVTVPGSDENWSMVVVIGNGCLMLRWNGRRRKRTFTVKRSISSKDGAPIGSLVRIKVQRLGNARSL
jgi:hypothetical protein